MIVAVYLSGLLTGITLILFPSAGTLFKDDNFHALSNSQFGVLFTPQIVTAIIASSGTASLAARFGMKQVLLAGLGFNLLSMTLLFLSHFAIGSGNLPFYLLLAATGAVGTGFGFSITALNAFAFDLFPGREDSAVTAMHVMTGIGQVGAALILALFMTIEAWWGAPVTIGLALIAMVVFQQGLPLTLRVEGAPLTAKSSNGRLPARVWLYAVIIFMYGAVEGTFGNWTPIYLKEEAGLATAQAALGLSLFWAAVTVGRVVFTAAAIRFETKPLHFIAPLVVGGTFILLPVVDGAAVSYAVLIIAGAALSFYFPYTVSLAAAENPLRTAAVAGLLVAALQLGNGISANVTGVASESVALGTLFQVASIYALVMAGVAFYLQWSFSRQKKEEVVL